MDSVYDVLASYCKHGKRRGDLLISRGLSASHERLCLTGASQNVSRLLRDPKVHTVFTTAHHRSLF